MIMNTICALLTSLHLYTLMCPATWEEISTRSNVSPTCAIAMTFTMQSGNPPIKDTCTTTEIVAFGITTVTVTAEKADISDACRNGEWKDCNLADRLAIEKAAEPLHIKK
jgi:hypothetical protein